MSDSQATAMGALFGHLIFYALTLGVGTAVSVWLWNKSSTKKVAFLPLLASLLLVALSIFGSLANHPTNPSPAAAFRAEVTRQKVGPNAKFGTDEASLRVMEEKGRVTVAKSSNVSTDEVKIKIVHFRHQPVRYF